MTATAPQVSVRSYHRPHLRATVGVGRRVWDAITRRFATVHEVLCAHRLVILLDGSLVVRDPSLIRAA